MPTMADLLRELRGAGDTARVIGSGIGHQIAGGYGAIADLATGKGLDAAVGTINRVGDKAAGPSTAEGLRNLQAVKDAVDWTKGTYDTGVDATLGKLPGVGPDVAEAAKHPFDTVAKIPAAGPVLAAGGLGLVEAGDPTKSVRAGKTAARAAERAAEKAIVKAAEKAPGKAAKSSLRDDVVEAVDAAEHSRARKDMTPEQASAAGMAPTVDNAQRVAYPGIYKRPAQIADEAKAMVGKESPLLKRLFGVTRADLQELSSRKGNIDDPIRELIPGASVNPTGSAAALSVMTPRNADRLLSAITETRRRAPELAEGMQGWYVMDPLYHRMVELHGGDKAAALKAYNRLNAFGGIESPNMAVPNETRRAYAANYLQEQGRFPEWLKHGGTPAEVRSRAGLLRDMPTVPGRVGHQRAAGAQQRVIETGEHGMDSPKAPLYIAASGVPEGRFQTKVPVADAHFTRASGISDTRTNKGYEASITTPELQTFTPWFDKNVSQVLGNENVPIQGEMWGTFAPQTGVKTEIGAPKLELIADLIGKRARQLGRSDLENVRDQVLMGKQHLGKATVPAMVAAGASAAGAQALINALRDKEEKK